MNASFRLREKFSPTKQVQKILHNYFIHYSDDSKIILFIKNLKTITLLNIFESRIDVELPPNIK